MSAIEVLLAVLQWTLADPSSRTATEGAAADLAEFSFWPLLATCSINPLRPHSSAKSSIFFDEGSSNVIRQAWLMGGLWKHSLLALVSLCSASVLAGSYVYVRRQSTRIQNLFLVHRDGRMMISFSRTSMAVDPDLFCGMLSVMQAYVADSMSSKDGRLEAVNWGRSSLVFAHGEHVFAAALCSSGAQDPVRRRLRESVDSLEKSSGPQLSRWDGTRDILAMSPIRQLGRLCAS